VPSPELEVVNDLLRAVKFSDMSLEQQRAAVESGAGSVPDGTEITGIDVGGGPCEWIATPGHEASITTIFSVRGGGYSLGSLNSNRHFCGLLSDTASARVLNVGYRNAPEHRFPAALDDAVRAYRWLVGTGTEPGTVALAGNSAGGGLVLAMLLALRDAGDPLPACAAVISPWTDLAVTGHSVVANAETEVMLDPAGIANTASLYADADLLEDPYVSPLYGDLAGLPPILIHVSGAEILLDDSTRLAAKALQADVDLTIEIVDHMPHVWHLFAGVVPEADDSLASLGLWLTRYLA
jgi:acetyl esterase/lipase